MTDPSERCSTARATLLKNIVSPGRRCTPMTIWLCRSFRASLRMTSSDGPSPRRHRYALRLRSRLYRVVLMADPKPGILEIARWLSLTRPAPTVSRTDFGAAFVATIFLAVVFFAAVFLAKGTPFRAGK